MSWLSLLLGDSPAEHYERTWRDRFHQEDLNEAGRRGLGFD